MPANDKAEVKPGLHAKLAEAWSQVEKVGKDGRNEHQKYDYVSAEAILSLLRPHLLSRGVTLVSELVDVGEREYTTSRGNASVITTVRVRFSFIDSATGESWSAEWAGQGDDPSDKGLGKAYTNAVKTFLRQQAMLPQGDDVEADPRADERANDRVQSKPVAEPKAMKPTSIKKVIDAFAAAEVGPEEFEMYLTSVGLEDATKMTPAHAVQLRALLDEREAKAAA